MCECDKSKELLDAINRQTRLLQEIEDARIRDLRDERRTNDIVDLQRRKNANQQAWLDKYTNSRR